jgi:HD-GYP domain-containing protein (c-di-GMP phosphodiesterase class II)
VTLRARTPVPESVPLSDVFSALSFALDLTEGQPMGHALRTCLVSMELGQRLGLPLQLQRDLYFAALLKDVGCSSNAAQVFRLFGDDDRQTKGARMRVDWSNYFRAAFFAMAHAAPGASWFERGVRIARLARGGTRVAAELVEVRCERGAEIVRQLGLGPGAAEAVRALDEHWDGRGHPRGLRGDEIPIVTRILTLAQTLEVFVVRDGVQAGLDVVRCRAGRWFDPLVASACSGMEGSLAEWRALGTRELQQRVVEAEPGGAAVLAGPRAMDRITQVFAEVVDAKSPFTGQHSTRTTQLAVSMAIELGWAREDVEELRRAGLMHDLGKLTVPNSILDKPSPLTASEWEVMRMHAYYTERILEHVRGFEWLAFASASHHERLDGSGYCRGLRGTQVPLLSRTLAVADIYDALSTTRPYRPALEQSQVLEIMERDRNVGLDPEAFDALRIVLGDESGVEAEERAA